MNRILRVWIGSWCLVVLALFLWLVVLPMAAHGATLAHATYTDPAGSRWCVTLGYTGQGADGTPWAWVTIDADSRRLVHVPLRDLRDLRDRCAQLVAFLVQRPGQRGGGHRVIGPAGIDFGTIPAGQPEQLHAGATLGARPVWFQR